MIRRLLLLPLMLCALMLVPALARESAKSADAAELSAPFRPGDFTAEELEFLQRALIFTGDFTGTADGIWGADSDNALIGYTAQAFRDIAPTRGDVGTLAKRFQDEIRQNDWVNFYLPGLDISFAFPRELVTQDSAAAGYDYHRDNDPVFFRLVSNPRTATMALHENLQAEINRADMHGHRETADRVTTDGFLPDGRWVYLRSYLGATADTTLVIRTAPGDVTRGRLIARTVRPGRHDPPQIRPDSLLQKILDAGPGQSEA